jgi:hypothetical protein
MVTISELKKKEYVCIEDLAELSSAGGFNGTDIIFPR